MHYKVLKSCVIDGSPVSAGDVVSVPEKEERDLLAIGRIVPHHEPKAEHRAVEVEGTSEVSSKRTYKKRK